MDDVIKKTIANLKRHRFHAYYAQTGDEAVKKVFELISKSQSVGIGGSMTIKDLGIYDEMLKRGYTVYSHWLGKDEIDTSQFEKERTADVYLCSANALMSRGALVNTDGLGNRVSYLFHGPKRVVVVCGKNKIVDGNYQDAIDRIKAVAAPKNVQRLGFEKNPCYITGRCHDCCSDERICCVTAILDEPTKYPFEREYHIIIVDENLGF